MKNITIDLYNSHIKLFKSQKEFQKWIKKNCDDDTSDYLCEMAFSAHGLAGWVHTINEEFTYYIMLERVDLPTLVHECGHITYMILDAVGVHHDVQNHEAFCYLLDNIFQKSAKAYGLLS